MNVNVNVNNTNNTFDMEESSMNANVNNTNNTNSANNMLTGGNTEKATHAFEELLINEGCKSLADLITKCPEKFMRLPLTSNYDAVFAHFEINTAGVGSHLIPCGIVKHEAVLSTANISIEEGLERLFAWTETRILAKKALDVSHGHWIGNTHYTQLPYAEGYVIIAWNHNVPVRCLFSTLTEISEYARLRIEIANDILFTTKVTAPAALLKEMPALPEMLLSFASDYTHTEVFISAEDWQNCLTTGHKDVQSAYGIWKMITLASDEDEALEEFNARKLTISSTNGFQVTIPVTPETVENLETMALNIWEEARQ